MTAGPSIARRLEALKALRQSAHDLGAAELWDRLTLAFKFQADPGAIFYALETLDRACRLAADLNPGASPALLQLCVLIEKLHQQSQNAGYQDRLGNRLSAGGGYLQGNLAGFELLGAVTTPAHDELASRVAALHLLMLSGMVLSSNTSTAVMVVAAASRKSRNNSLWTFLIQELPDPADTPAHWPETMVAWSTERLQRQGREPDARAIEDFCRALKTLSQLLLSAPKSRADQLSLELEPLDTGHVVREPIEPRRGPRAARRERGDDDPLRQAEFARFLEGDEDNPAGQEPTSIVLLQRLALPETEPTVLQTVVAQESRVVSFRLAEIDQVLRWSWDHLNPQETQLVASATKRQIQARAPGWEAAVLAATVLATGQPVADVVKWPMSRRDDEPGLTPLGNWTRHILRPAQAWKPGAHLPHLRAHAETLTLPLPAFLAAAYRSLRQERPAATTVGELLGISSEQALARLSRWLDPIRTAHPSARLTLGRLWRALAVELYAGLGNDAAVHFITATSRDVAPTSSYYTALPVLTLEQSYERAVDRLFGTDHISPQSVASDQIAPMVGSRKAVDADWLRGVVRRLASEVQLHPDDLARTHNAYVTYTLWLLMFATGHRPVTHPIESLDIVDFDALLLSVSDKLVRDPREARMVPLCQIAAATLRSHVEHLQRLAGHVQPRQARLAAAIRSTLTSAGPRALPLFFYLEPDLEVVPISSAQLLRFVPEFAPLQANLARHLLSSGEAALGDNADLVREMLGHVRHAQPLFGPQSPLCTSHYEPVRRWLDEFLGSLGWTAVESPLPGGPLARRPTTTAAHRMELGQEMRRKAALASEQKARERVHTAIKSGLARKKLSTLDQANVDAIFRGILGNAKVPGNPIQLEACRRVYRLLAWCRRRWEQHYKLPAVLVPVPTMPQAFDFETLAKAKRARRLSPLLLALLQSRARDLRHPLVSGGRLVAEALASLIIDSRVADPEVAQAVCDGSSFELLSDGDAGVHVVIPRATDTGRTPMFWRYPLHPLTAALLARLRDAQHRGIELKGRHEQIVALVGHLALQLDPQHEFKAPARALRWLCDLVSALNFVELPGTVAGYLDGSTQAVSLPPNNWARLVRDLPLKPDAADASTTDPVPGEERVEVAEVPLPALFGPRDDPAPGLALARARALHKAASRLLNTHIRAVAPAAQRGLPGRNQKETLIPALTDLVERSSDAPMLARACVQWLIQLMQQGVDGNDLRASSCARYYYALAPFLPEVLADLDFQELNDDALTEAYSSFIELLSESSQLYAFHRLQVFHRFLMAHHGLPPLDWSEIAPPTLLSAVGVDAGLMTWPEYETALSLLASDPAADERTKVLQAVVWLLAFRFGLRISEALGLRRKDLVWDTGHIVLLIRHNAFRELKTDSAIRQVPLIGPLSTLEGQLLESWKSHVDTCFAPDRLAAMLACADNTRRLVDTQAITRRITEALHAASGDKTMRIHHGRHSFGCRLQLIMNLDAVESAGPAAKLVKRALGPVDPVAARRLLLDSPQLSRRGLWAAKLALGHASPVTTQRCYFHLDDVLTQVATASVFQRQAVSLSRTELAYVTGIAPAALPQAAGGARQRLAMTRILRLQAKHFVSSSSRVGAPGMVRLPSRPAVPATTMTVAQADLALGFAYRRGAVDGAHRTLLLPAVQLQALFTADFEVREAAGYDLPDARWPATQATLAVKHARVGARSPSESARVAEVIRNVQANLASADYLALCKELARIWKENYRADSTPLVVRSVEEIGHFVRWSVRSGIEPAVLSIRLPQDQEFNDGAEDGYLADITAACEQAAGGYRIQIETGRLPLVRARFRQRDARRYGFLVRENNHGVLTQMSQFHRVMHVLASLLGSELAAEG